MVLRSPQSAKAGQSRPGADFASAALRSGNAAGARQYLQDRLLKNPRDADALTKLAEVAVAERNMDEAALLLRRAVAADPSRQRRMALILHLKRYASPAVALQAIEELPSALRAGFDVRAIEAALLGVLGLHERQIRLYQEMVRERSGKSALWMSLGNALKTVGRTDEAVAALRRGVAAEPTFGEAYWTLANFKSFAFSDRDLAQMRQALRRKLSDQDALHIHFALGKAYEDRGDYEQSFRHYAEGNALRAATFRPGQTSVTELVDQSIATFTPEFFERNAGAGSPEAGPIFVVGLNRSGSTLVEQILASHPLIEGTTELAVMNHMRDRLADAAGTNAVDAIAGLDRAQFAAIGAEYLERTRAFRHTDRPFFVDKMPANWTNLPLIRIALPKAKIIDARRHPMACGFSNFKQNYAHGIGFSYRLETIGAFYRDYWRFMRHFDEVQPGAVHRIINERLIDDPEEEVKRLLEFVGVPFDPACLDFHKTDRAVRTPSAEQVRRPINREGVDYWRHYESWLGELHDALGDALDGWER
ncbi:MAG: tetratricopeptide repeat-containing sulfotransferase family protein [Sphingomicrobium sp.]